MLLAVDAGNTNVVFALFSPKEGGTRQILGRWRIATDPRRTADEYAVWLLQLMQIGGISRGDVTQMIIATVVPRARHNREVRGQRCSGKRPFFAGEGAAEWQFPLDGQERRSLGG